MKILLKATCGGCLGCDFEEEIEIEDGTTQAELDEMANEFALDRIAPEGWWEEV